MNFVSRHLLVLAIIASVIALCYVAVVITTSKALAADIGIGYISVIITISFVWELAHYRRDHRDHHG